MHLLRIVREKYAEGASYCRLRGLHILEVEGVNTTEVEGLMYWKCIGVCERTPHVQLRVFMLDVEGIHVGC